jgi:xanthine dehydrogenase YagT iron-sulfur-binding subunit
MADEFDEKPSSPQGEKNEPTHRLSRRSFLTRAGAAGILATGAPLAGVAAATADKTTGYFRPGTVSIVLNVNRASRELHVEPRVTLLDALRENLRMTGTKKGCDHGQCGACTVHVNGRRINSCMTLAVMHQDDQITTIEGLAQNGKLHPVQAAFLEHDGFQCGYCTPGQIMSATALLDEPHASDDDTVREFMSGNICRCGAYNNIVAAIQDARQRM